MEAGSYLLAFLPQGVYGLITTRDPTRDSGSGPRGWPWMMSVWTPAPRGGHLTPSYSCGQATDAPPRVVLSPSLPGPSWLSFLFCAEPSGFLPSNLLPLNVSGEGQLFCFPDSSHSHVFSLDLRSGGKAEWRGRKPWDLLTIVLKPYLAIFSVQS